MSQPYVRKRLQNAGVILFRLAALLSLAVSSFSGSNALAQGASYSEGFDNVGTTQTGQDGPSNLIAAGWIFRNQSQPKGPRSWFGSGTTQAFGPHSGTGFLANDWNSTVCGKMADISNWAILPAIPNQAVGDQMSFYVTASVYHTRDDRLQVLYSPTGGSNTGSGWQDTGDFTTLLLDINPIPKSGWVKQQISLPGPGRIAFRYYLPDADYCNLYGGFFGIDTLVIGTPPAGSIPLPQPGQTVTWSRSISPVVINGRVIIQSGGTVVVEPGVEIQVNRDSTLVVEGTLRGSGTLESPIQVTAPAVFPPALEVSGTLEFTSASIGGQVRPLANSQFFFSNVTFQNYGTVFSGSILSGLPPFIRVDQSHFNGVDFYISDSTVVITNSDFTNASFRMVRGYLYQNNITVDGGSFNVVKDYQPVYINNLTVRNSMTAAGLSVGGTQSGNNFFLGPNVVLQNNLYPVFIGSGGLLPGSTVPATGNVNNQIYVSGEMDQRGPAVWADLGIPYRIDEFPILIGRWELQPGVKVLLGPDAGLEADGNGFIARGRPDKPVILMRRDPGASWRYIMTPGRIEYGVIEGSQLGLIYSTTAPPEFIDSSILRNHGRALVGSVIVRGSQFLSNQVGAHISFPADLLGQTNPNSFEGNALAVETAQDARYNWWGSSTGPRTTDNPGGTGDPIASGIPFSPFRTSRPNYADHPPLVYLKPVPSIFEPGSRVILAWDAADNLGINSQRILFTSDAGTTVIANNLPGSQRSIEWTVPDIGFQVTGSTPSLRIEATDTIGQIGWDSVPAFIPSRELTGTITFTVQPSGTYKIGDLVDVCWTVSGTNEFGDTVDGFLLLDGGRRAIDLGAPLGDNCYNDIPLPWASTDTARIAMRIGGSLNRVKYFYSNYFTIRPDPRVPDAAPSVTLSAPANGSSFAAGSVVPINWTASDNEGLRSFDIQASYDGGRSWHVIAKDLPGTATSFNWQTASGSGFADIRLRVVAVDQRFQDSSATRTISLTGSGGGGGSSSIHVADLDGTGTTVSNKMWRATVAISVHDANHNPVAGVTVSGGWSGGYSGSAQCVTATNGTCTVTTGNIRTNRANTTFTVNSLGKSGYTYTATSNHDPDGSSNGTSITINKP